MTMHYHDPIYGNTMLREPVLVDLVQSDAVQRLQGVLQHGISGLIGLTPPLTRFEHSVGVMLLVRGLGGSLREQIAALLHDVSHTAFSHVIDYVYNAHDSQGYHDAVKEGYIAGTDLPSLLAEYGYDFREFLDEGAYPLLEQPAPRLCADRLDYFLRDSLGLDLATPSHVRLVLKHLVVHEGRIATDDVTTARWLAYTFMAADEESWANFHEVGLYELTAMAIRRALEIEVLDENDFWGVDVALWQKLQAAPDPELQQILALVRPDTQFEWDDENPTFVVSTKIRTIDPDVALPDGSAVPLSRLDREFAAQRRRYLQEKQGQWPMRVVPPEGTPPADRGRRTADSG
ncbi:MAG: HD domain-containing protein [Chloroflexota bacterium]